MRFGYIASHYPAVSHAFLVREVRALRRLGLDVETFSIHRAPVESQLAQADREEAGRTFSVLPIGPWGLLRAHLAAFTGRPAAYVRTLGLAVRSANPGL